MNLMVYAKKLTSIFLPRLGESRVRNFWYLFAAYTIIWTAMFAYIINLSKKNKELRDELNELQTQVQRHLAQKETT